jgi:hypothetical protein
MQRHVRRSMLSRPSRDGLIVLISSCVISLLLIMPAVSQQAASRPPVLLFGIGVHIEPFGAQVSALALNAGAQLRTIDPRQMDYTRRPDFERHVEDLLRLATTVESHGGRLTVQAQSPFTTSAARYGHTILADLEGSGHEIALHFHENVHLGDQAESLASEIWTAVMEEQLDLIHRAGVKEPIHAWSGGNLYPQVLHAAAAAGLSINADWKNPNTQSAPSQLIGIHPWRPAGGTDGEDVTLFSTHDPAGAVVFLPGGLIDPVAFANKNLIRSREGLEGWLAVLEDALMTSLDAARSDRINTFHFTVHPGEFVGDPAAPYELLADFLDDVVDPLVAAGRIQWATFSQMADAFASWETAHPGIDPRS